MLLRTKGKSPFNITLDISKKRHATIYPYIYLDLEGNVLRFFNSFTGAYHTIGDPPREDVVLGRREIVKLKTRIGNDLYIVNDS